MLPTVYIPTLLGGDRLARALEALSGQTEPATVVVADNGPGDGCRRLLEERFPEAVRVGFGRNLGFGAAVNAAVEAHGDGPIILLNDDAVPRPGFVEALLAAHREGAGMVAAALLRAGDPELIDTAGVDVDATAMGFDHLTGEPAAALETAADPLGPSGGGALYDRSLFEAVGGFDRRIFLYYEDVDLALRMRAEGARCLLAPAARALHGHSETLGAGTAGKYAASGWSRGYMLRRYGVMGSPGPALRALAAEGAVCAGQLLSDRTLAGARGRISGWRAAAGLKRRRLPADGLLEAGLIGSLRLRRRRRAV